VGITYAPQIKKDEGEIDWTQSAVSIERLVRAFMPWPGTFTYWNTRQLKIHAGYVGDGNLEASTVDNIDGRLAIGTGNGIYYPTMLQLEGKQSLPVDEFVRGRSDIIGVTLGHKKLL
jgi:methionyl-tRNA formyltransferase